MEEIVLSLIEAFKSLSYFGIVLSLTFEFVPAEIVLPMVGYWVYQGDMNLYLAILAGSIGGVTGPLTLYFLGKYGGRPIVKKLGKYFFIKEKELEASDRFFEKYGAPIAFFGRFIPVIRTAISFPCGILKMNVWKFIIYTYLAMLPVTTLYVYVGYTFGEQFKQAAEVVSGYLNYVFIAVVVFIVFYIVKQVKANKNKQTTL